MLLCVYVRVKLYVLYAGVRGVHERLRALESNHKFSRTPFRPHQNKNMIKYPDIAVTSEHDYATRRPEVDDTTVCNGRSIACA